ncbi:MAG: ABC transporter ATP-binding protein [Geminicoccaceae bacterium]|nr:ABC transporter ATP-binding protein [Geminicoccaceae bacterium]MCS7268011.1 ABC transporter ATP-binding protein [Geminicoccaceae bacterium]
MTRRPVLLVEDLTVALPRGADRAFAVEGASFAVAPGEILCLVGESGSGKSVTAQAIMGLLPKGQLEPVRGRVLLEQESLLDAPPSRLRALRGAKMAMIFQEPMTALNPVMRCGAQIDEVLRTHTRLSPAERYDRILAILEEVRLPDPERFARAYPHELSGGQRQRIMIAMALVMEPVLLIADEPTTALDVTTQAQILCLIKDLQARHGTAVLFITHDFGIVAEIADRVAVMQWGRIVEQGPKDEILRRPRHPYTRMLIGSVPSLSPRHPRGRTNAPVVLRTEKLGKIYEPAGFFRRRPPVRAAEAVDLVIRKGEVLGIVGESGSGKSTVARCIARLTDPSEGEVWLGSDPIGRLPVRALRPHRRRVQVVFQDPYRSLNPRRTVGESITEGPVNFGLSPRAARARAEELMRLVRLDPAALDRYPHQFSGGQRQRICIARALAMEPELLIADEAVSALDVSVQAQVLRLLDEIRERLELAVLFITHDLRVAAQLCDRVAVMHRGRVVEEGDAATVLATPRHPYTRELIAAAPGRDYPFFAG